jgi:hypothetical protein
VIIFCLQDVKAKVYRQPYATNGASATRFI